MLGYGLANSYVQKYSVENIIISFLNRMLIPNLTYFMGLKILINKNFFNVTKDPISYLNKNIESFEDVKVEAEYIYKLFLEDEYFITRTLEYKNTNLEVDYQKELYKYILSSNIVNNKDYNFTKKLKESTIFEGDDSLRKIFFDFLLTFMNETKLLNGQEKLINDLLINNGYKLFFSYNDVEKIYIPLPNLTKILYLIVLKYSKDIRKYSSSGFYIFYNNNNYFNVRDSYLKILKKQISGINGKRVI